MSTRSNSYRLAIMGMLAAAATALPLRAAVPAEGSQVTVTTDGPYRFIRANGLPNHETGQFPTRGNPNSISAQDYMFRVPMMPSRSPSLAGLQRFRFGVALNGVPFDPVTAGYWNNDRQSGWRNEAMLGTHHLGIDQSNAHVQRNGAYHYHGVPRATLADVSADRHSPLVGYAADGFPIYALFGYVDPKDPSKGVRKLRSAWRLKGGERNGVKGPGGRYDGTFTQDWQFVEGQGDLDRANARFTVTPEYPKGTYAYFLTDGFPYVPRYFIGTPDPSFLKGNHGHRLDRVGRLDRAAPTHRDEPHRHRR